ncbi:MAG TPA: acyl-CoA dehydrogenase family protein [Deltaproteobacteria bacterium]|nr:acyl-CoA dehydrogenase family protein [Deltaproteobacteria bacterium]
MRKNLDELFIFPRQLIDEESGSVISLVRQWAEKEILSKRMEYRENYSRLFGEQRDRLNLTIGLQWLTLPEKNGGFGWNDYANAPGITSVLCEIGRADASIGALLAMEYTILATIAMKHNLNRKLCDRLASHYVSDEVRTPALILPGPGSLGHETPLFHGRSIGVQVTTAKGGYTLSGEGLRPLTAGSIADLFCVVCTGKKGEPCIALVPDDTPGIRRTPPVLATGLNACINADISFDSATIPKENVIDRPGIVEELYTWLNLYLGAVSIGAGANFFEILSDWSETRVIKGGTTLKENPLCASVLAEVAEEIAMAKILLYDLAHLLSIPEEWSGTNASRSFTFSGIIGSRVQAGVLKAINRGMELMGSAGYAKEWHAEKHWRDVKTIQSLLCGVAAEAPVRMDTARFFYNCTEL